MRQPRELRKLLRFVPDQAEEFVDLVDEAGGGPAAMPVLQRGEVGGGDLEVRREVLQRHPALAAELTEPGAEGGHTWLMKC